MGQSFFTIEACGFCAALALLVLSPALSGCSSPSTYAGINLGVGPAASPLQALARRASSGDKHAQLELGIHFEEGIGVPVNLRKAEKLYRAAARDSGGTLYAYVPPVGARGGRVEAISREAPLPGLAEAKRRLERLLRAQAPER